ncbi:unnamed protein product [Spirodela intermedia]|uniref:Integrase catalytic domain-containing protein n=1 Tax=Spirodela intermedia TaxID=51605 RepID=A0ABN7E942_SPIIN|nr:unnamed protein product [Spirodela intermedia]
MCDASNYAVGPELLKKNGVHHRVATPYHPQTNGGARVKELHLRSAQQEEALHRIWYALKRWRLRHAQLELEEVPHHQRQPRAHMRP